MGKFTTGIAMGALVGGTVGMMMMMPKFNKKAEKSMRKASKKMMNMAEDSYDNMLNWIK